ncbi:MAG: GPW/gp25 family protein [Burkholderiaceae bacterium]|nr:GPW/gp25 family protein [Burkholderiaceae bacterium]
MTTLAEIQSLHWQPALGADGVVENISDIHQAIHIILRTPKGSDPLRPTFGSNVWQYIDHPVNRVVPYLVRESVDAIQEWEPRCELVKVIPTIDESHITLRVQWKLKDGVLRETEIAL